MSIEWSIDHVSLHFPAHQRLRTVAWAAMPVLGAAALLAIPGAFTLWPDPYYNVERCWPGSRVDWCVELEPELAGGRWPDNQDWENGRVLQLQAGAPAVMVAADEPLDSPAIARFLAMAEEVDPTHERSWRGEVLPTQLEAEREARALHAVYRRLLARNVQRAKLARTLDLEEHEQSERIRFRAGIITAFAALILAPPVFVTVRRRLGDLGDVDLDVSTHQVTLDGHTWPRTGIASLQVEGSRIVLTLVSGERILSSPVPTSLIDDADAACAAFAALDPAGATGTVPAALQALRDRH